MLCVGMLPAQAQDKAEIEEGEEKPVISYSLAPKKYTIAGIRVSGVDTVIYKDYTLVGFSGLSVGNVVAVPGDEITSAVKRFWKHGLFSDVKILADRIRGDSIWLEICLQQRPRISEVNYMGVKKSEKDELDTRLGSFKKGFQITPNVIDRAKTIIQKYFDAKGFKNVTVEIVQKDDLANEGQVIVDVIVDKNEKTRIHRIHFEGNAALTNRKLKAAMKKTNERFDLKYDFKTSWRELFSTKKFTSEEYEKDKENIVTRYNEFGYRDAMLVSDSVVNFDAKTVDIYLNIDEGRKYYLKDIRFVGNTQYQSDYLLALLNMKAGDVYNQKKLGERLTADEDAVSNVYFNNGYLFFNADPVETDISGDSITLEIRIQEGPQATINRIIINGNDRLYEDVVRRELRTKPGTLFNRDELIRSVRELAQMGHFDPENMNPVPIPDPENGTVDIEYNLTSKANDQVELSAGYGQTGLLGRLSFKFTNFSLKNFLSPKTYKGIIPQGEGQTLTLSGQTNGRYYQSYSLSFLDPWFGGKRPNSFSVTTFYSRQTGVSSSYLSNSMYNNPYYYSNGGYSNYYGSSSGSNYYDNYYESAYDPDKHITIGGVSVGYGKRLNWPDDYFQFMATFNYQLYSMKNWGDYFQIANGTCHSLNLELLLQRSSVDNPLYTRRGSQFTLSVSATPPYSLWDGKQYATMSDRSPEKFKFIEYHKWKFKARIFAPLAPVTVKRTPVLMARAEYGFLGYYSPDKLSPFETYYMGGDGMTGYSSMYATETIGLRGYENGSISSNAYAYSRLSMELRYPFLLEPTSTIYGLLFVEAGNAWNSVKRFNPFDLKRAAGVGVRIFLPMIGLIGIDWAYGFDKPNSGATSTRSGSQFHFIIGQEF
jgi:outer membrane protein insertion porin family